MQSVSTEIVEATPQTEVILFSVTEQTIAEQSEKYLALKINGTDDKEGLAVVKTAKQSCVKARSAIKAAHETAKAPYLEAGRKLDALKNKLIALIEPVEAHLADQIKTVEAEAARIEEEKLDKRLAERAERLRLVGGTTATPAQVRTMQDSDFGAFLMQCAENNRIKREQEEAQAKLDAERRQFEADRAAYNAKIRAEQEAHAAKLRAEQAERDAESERQRRANEAERQRIFEAEQARLHAEQAEAERLRKLSILPYAERLHIFAAQVENLQPPHECGGDLVRQLLADCADGIRRVADGF